MKTVKKSNKFNFIPMSDNDEIIFVRLLNRNLEKIVQNLTKMKALMQKIL